MSESKEDTHRCVDFRLSPASPVAGPACLVRRVSPRVWGVAGALRISGDPEHFRPNDFCVHCVSATVPACSAVAAIPKDEPWLTLIKPAMAEFLAAGMFVFIACGSGVSSSSVAFTMPVRFAVRVRRSPAQLCLLRAG